jgi:hypothetical protein
VDLTFWLTGDYTAIHRRKGEFSVLELQSHDQRYSRALKHYRIPFEKIDVTTNDLARVTDLIGKRILDFYQGRTALDNLPPALKAMLL